MKLMLSKDLWNATVLKHLLCEPVGEEMEIMRAGYWAQITNITQQQRLMKFLNLSSIQRCLKPLTQ